MANDLVVYERALKPLAPRFQAVLANSMDAGHLIQTVLIAIERNPKLMEATMESILAGAMTFANLRLPCDGVTGQGFLIPFKNSKLNKTLAQPVIGYKGFNTIGARSGLTITGGVWREGDLEFDYREGSGGFVHHKRRLDNQGPILAAWAVASAHNRPDAVSIVGIKEILEIKARSPAVRYNAETPWTDTKIGFPAMAEKTPKRRLSRILPFEIDGGRYQLAARLDEAHDEQGKYAYIGERGDMVIDGAASPLADREPSPTPTKEALTGPPPDLELARLRSEGFTAAGDGVAALKLWFEGLSGRERNMIGDYLDNELKPRARKIDGDRRG
jgi:recombination protein RecT